MMMSKGAALILLLMLGSMNVILANIKPVKAINPAIVIKPDGSIEGTDRIQRNGDFYYLTDNIEISSSSRGSSGILIQRDNITLDGKGFSIQTERSTNFGILLTESFNVTVQNSTIKGFTYGIHLNSSSKITISGNNISDCYWGISLGGYWVAITSYNWHRSNNVSIINNSIMDNDRGIDLLFSPQNVISGNMLTNNTNGVHSRQSNYNIIVRNSFTENNGFAIVMYDCRNNTFYHNNFINNKVVDSIQIRANWYCRHNAWDNGFEGNYWSDYTSRYSNATEVDGSGIWGVPFFIKEANIDRFPLTEPVDIELATSLLLHPPEICVSSPENTTYITDSVSLNFTVNEATSWMGYSLDGQNNITVTETTLNLPELSDGSHSLTVYANDTAGDMGKSETMHFTIDTFPTIWVIVSIAMIALVGAAFLVYFLKIKKATKPE
jgi:parallel beta-helix repeat protein